jgi:2-polyprenyl-3-methyl-5-hydroxy-6-metoxy-1,4-benzoquinol methylase
MDAGRAPRGLTCSNYDPFFFPDTLKKANSGDICLNEPPYDFVVSSEYFEHFYAPRKEILQINDLLKDGGWLGIMTSRVANDTEVLLSR